MAFPSREEKYLPATHVALALAYVILANHDHVKLHTAARKPRHGVAILSRPAAHG